MDGYKIIDLKGIPILDDGTTTTIPGVFNAINTANKPMVIANLVIQGENTMHVKPFFTNIVSGDANDGYETMFVTMNMNLLFSVSPNDGVALIPLNQ